MNFKNYSVSTERLVIRAFSETDASAIYAIKTEHGFSRYIHDDPWTSQEDAEEFINFALWLYTDDIKRDWFRLFFAICAKQTNELIGYCGFGNTEYMPNSVEVFYGITIKHQNKGYAYESCRAMIQTANSTMGIKDFIGFVHNQNKASQKVLEKAGFEYARTIRDAPAEHGIYNGQLLYAKHIPS